MKLITKTFRRVVVLSLPFFFAACAGIERVKDSSPETSDYPYRSNEASEVRALENEIEPSLSPAVSALLAQAKSHQEQQQWELASSKLERALRIAPSSPWVHLKLAELRLQQDQAYEALQLALKGQSLLMKEESELARSFWRVIGDSHTLLGNSDKANQAYSHL